MEVGDGKFVRNKNMLYIRFLLEGTSKVMFLLWKRNFVCIDGYINPSILAADAAWEGVIATVSIQGGQLEPSILFAPGKEL